MYLNWKAVPEYNSDDYFYYSSLLSEKSQYNQYDILGLNQYLFKIQLNSIAKTFVWPDTKSQENI